MKTYFNWSTGKDSAMALHSLLSNKEYSIDHLVTTVNSDLKRVSMHGLREELLDIQVKNIGIPLRKLYLSGNVSMSSYDAAMKEFTSQLVREKYTHTAFGDIFLEDLRAYRESKLNEAGITSIFPIWKKDTKILMEQFISLGFKAITVCVNAKLLDESFVGREVDASFLNDLPDNVDPCGENGEFHTFVYDGPIFKEPVLFEKGDIVLKSYSPFSNDQDDDCYKHDTKSWDTSFWYCDLLPK